MALPPSSDGGTGGDYPAEPNTGDWTPEEQALRDQLQEVLGDHILVVGSQTSYVMFRPVLCQTCDQGRVAVFRDRYGRLRCPDCAAPQPVTSRAAIPGRNQPCHCGSGKKYKRCHMREDTRK